ncbi:hypothetical protein LZA78_03830 [Sinirhodobacter sp. WL0062]|uniref:Uncharacterized protein n=1 Tax=Rhodobacter flavimaris TaxID=2907145 RepID=A0ABS8YY35_9RHOB|nr:hypothetical protein [Sinirhodobacter sp. WL0062]MCE5972605.1 hypothetical protein [Sinirhodobacter sp. WL0062]
MADEHTRAPSGLTPEAIKRIEAGLNRHFKTAAPQISAESWQQLTPILARYQREAALLRGFLNKGDANLLNKAAKRSSKLLEDLAKVKESDLTSFIENAIGPSTLNELETTLRVLAQTLSFTPREGQFLQDVSRDNLYMGFETWWQRATGEPPWIEEGRRGKAPPTPFMYVANEVFNLPGMPSPTGASYAALKDLRRRLLKRHQKTARLGERLRALSLQDPPSDAG